PNVGPVELSVNRIAFSPGAEPYALWTADESGPAPAGVPVQGGARRLAFAWALQTTRVLSTDNVPRGALLLWPRGVAERLERFVPFARFGAPYPVVNRGRVIWLAPGYVTASAYPLSVVADMAGRRARFMSASLLGVVDAAAGSTAVYLLPDADLLARAWAQFAPDAVRGPDQLPADLLPHLRYPEELFAAQLAVALRGGADGLPTPPSRREAADQRPAWLPAAVVEAAPGGLALHAVAAGEAGALEATLDGVMDRGIARLVLTRLREPRAPRPLPLPTDVAAGRSHILAFPEGVVRITPAFRASGSDGGEVPRFGDVTVEVGEAVGRGATLAEALLRLRLAIGSAPGTGAQWAEARRWFARMDQARRSGDWADFGRAWRELERLLGVPADTTR
ncbi:MAG TPA: UPF0182 family protein, partial [Gemmatimonadales bacterium]|nr:UPF0182 family protein [Gemmatimonadales bacterium]